MTIIAVGIVLLAAILHATWNAVAKRVTNRLELFACTYTVGLVAAAPLLWWVTPPARGSWIWLGASVAVHVLYNGGLLAAYRVGDFNQAYPIARGVGPLVVAGVASTVLGEPLSRASTAGVVLIAGAVAVLGLFPWRLIRANRETVILAALTGVTIAGYTLVDGIGVRASGHPMGYIVWLLGMQSLVTVLAIVIFRRLRPAGGITWQPLFGSGAPWATATAVAAMSMLAYGLVLWAQTRGALAAVAALRESSVVVAAGIGSVFFGEPLGRSRIVASVAVAAGAVLLAVQGS